VANFDLNSGVLRFSNGGFARTNSFFGRLATYTVEIWGKIAGTIGFTSLLPTTAAHVSSTKMEYRLEPGQLALTPIPQIQVIL
jgi:hypothetical protein